jgi:hypothetical protein
MTRYPLISLTVLLGLALSCAPDAPHDNPVDPASPEFSNTGGINGRVTLLSDPRVGIPGVEVSVGAEGPVFLTGADGSFIIANHAAGPVTLIASKLGYLSDTAIVTIEPARALPVEIRLDALPVIAQGTIITEKIDEYFPGPTYRALISADVSDPDGLADLDSVWTVIENLWFPMAYSPTSRLYEATVFDYNLPTNNLQWLVGKELHVVARDFAGASADAGNIFVTRIIEDSAFPLSPASGDTAASSPLLVWNPAQATFFHTLTLAIVRQDAGTQTPIWSQEGIDASLQSFQYGDTLVSGSYFWTIAVVDGFGNLCRSKPSSFIVN